MKRTDGEGRARQAERVMEEAVTNRETVNAREAETRLAEEKTAR